VPVDRWAWPEMAAMREAVTGLRDRIRPEDTWRMTIERRAETPVDADAIIRELAEIIDARVDLRRPDKILLVQLFGNRVAFSVLGPADVFSVVKVLAARPAPTPGGTTTAPGDEEATRLTA
jgi:tRNA(Ser,Leu) C12 N-acetylase TAN1